MRYRVLDVVYKRRRNLAPVVMGTVTVSPRGYVAFVESDHDEGLIAKMAARAVVNRLRLAMADEHDVTDAEIADFMSKEANQVRLVPHAADNMCDSQEKTR